MSNDAYNKGYSYDTSVSTTTVFATLMKKVYVWMTLALTLTGMTAYYVTINEALMFSIFSNQAIFWGLMIAEIAVVLILAAAINKLSFPVAAIMMAAYSILNGVTMSAVFVVYTASSITTTFLVTAGTFAAMALVGYFTKKDLTKMGGILLMALIGLIIASVVNFFLNNSTMDYIISFVGVLIFTGLTAYDSQKIKNLMLQCDAVDANSQKLALLGSLTLYLDFINLFLYLLRFLGERK